MGRQIEEEAVNNMIQAFKEFSEDAWDCINKIQDDANTCADNMAEDKISADIIIKLNHSIRHYRQACFKADETCEMLRNKLEQLGDITSALSAE